MFISAVSNSFTCYLPHRFYVFHWCNLGHRKWKMEVKCLFFSHSHCTACTLIDRQNPWKPLLTCYWSGSGAANRIYSPISTRLLFFPSLSSYKMSRLALNYWLSWNPMWLTELLACCCLTAASQFLLLAGSLKPKMNSWSGLWEMYNLRTHIRKRFSTWLN